MWFKIKLYINYLINSTNQHGVHSPFVFNLVTKCLYQKTPKKKINPYKRIKSILNKNSTVITIQDFGKGSKIFKSNNRKVSDIAKVAGISLKKAKLLINLVTYFKPLNILEIGTSVGLASATMATLNPKSRITTLEGCKETSKVAQNLFYKLNLNNITIIEGEFKNTLHKTTSNSNFDFIYIDGNHQKKTTLAYFEQCLNSIHNNSFIIFDDINWTEEMNEAWKIIKQHPKVTVTIDLYFWGIVFFRKEQVKQHFIIRI
ncbi:class I SAM-dependent methyltransferase [Lutibacter sp. TH_r2]|uniref:O-methyltransferase n=1 Tax=Lutibacter sp. TH_r2 TaxID=3082083 RepID=UPI002952A3B2|nr:class I SAM-dependent methyltransferase [Lutibacter sp. TH_r2]MDV7188405.1 class I SAM-dependent methyltransferase [Lutibacter sp. TH_r2]